MNINRKEEHERPRPRDGVTVKECGNLIEVRYSVNAPPETVIQKLTADLYLDKRTGEVKAFRHTENRAEDKPSVAQSLCRLRDLINTNVTDPNRVLWVTLTYRENMRDPSRLYEDFRRYRQRLNYYLDKRGQPKCEYIAAAEPQGRGAWHLHLLLLFPDKAPFIPNTEMARLWGQGFTKTKSLKGVDNPGLYLTAYLGDMELTEAVTAGQFQAAHIQEKAAGKAVVKGARLRLYPSGFNLYRCSRGVKRPQVIQMTEGEARQVIRDAPLVYEKTIAVLNGEGETVNIINYRQYNRARVEAKTAPGERPAETAAGSVGEAPKE